MPELPEVETLRRDLDREVVGKRIKTVEVTGRSAMTRLPKKQFIARLEGTKVSGGERRGLLLTLKLDSAELLVIDIRNGGQLRRTSAREPVVKGTQVVITFTQGGQFRLIDDTSGMDVWVTTPDDLLVDVPGLSDLGLDPLEEPISWTTFGQLLLRRRAKLKAILVDPSAVNGIGPVYSDEILHAAGLRHDRTSDGLSSQEMRRLYRALVETLHDAAKHRGTTLADGRYTDLAGKLGDYQSELKVYERDGQACKRCRAVVTKAKVSGKTLYFCPECQV
ncbi:MAG: DNA-formamidopyrimidine glycosylase family protein [Acidimicrobiales bacterium]